MKVINRDEVIIELNKLGFDKAETYSDYQLKNMGEGCGITVISKSDPDSINMSFTGTTKRSKKVDVPTEQWQKSIERRVKQLENIGLEVNAVATDFETDLVVVSTKELEANGKSVKDLEELGVDFMLTNRKDIVSNLLTKQQ